MEESSVELMSYESKREVRVPRRPTRVEVVDAPASSQQAAQRRSTVEGLRSQLRSTTEENISEMSSRVRSFYLSQERLLSSFADVDRMSAAESSGDEDDGDRALLVDRSPPLMSARRATQLSMALNVVLFIAKLVATVLSGSLSVLSSVVDSALDLFTGVVLFLTERFMRPSRRDHYTYPVGKRRMEPVAIVVCAAVMGTASLQLIVESAQSIVKGDADPDLNALSGSIMGLAVVTKLGLFLICRRIRTPSVQALALDHRNDTASNMVAILFGLLGTHVKPWLDPVGAMLIAVYIIWNWVRAGREQMEMLVGRAADTRTLQQLTWAALNHHDEILQVSFISVLIIVCSKKTDP